MKTEQSYVIPLQEREKMMKSLTLYKNSRNPDAKKAQKIRESRHPE